MQSYDEYQRIKPLAAFNVVGATARRRLNQHAKEYRFSDGSTLKIYRKGRACAFDSNGFGIVVGTIRANAFGDNV